MVTAHQEQSKVNERRPSASWAADRKSNGRTKLIDAVILVLSLIQAHAIGLYLVTFMVSQ